MRHSIQSVVCLGALFAVALAISTGSARAWDHYGAIAYSSDTKGWGTSYDDASRGLAEAWAMSRCSASGDQGCRVVLWFKNACGALVVGPGGSGWGWAYARGTAERIALNQCNANGSGCQIQAWACTTR
ncbi:DUF4189 domain-containing protein [Methyloceanibacter sp.]|uniref:DUF4189 domain-containing protein n=1 Tax=Methyloceanibacter sp. TaxID=1965321 RepID=UPI003D6CC3B3